MNQIMFKLGNYLHPGIKSSFRLKFNCITLPGYDKSFVVGFYALTLFPYLMRLNAEYQSMPANHWKRMESNDGENEGVWNWRVESNLNDQRKKEQICGGVHHPL